jgi:Zn finger protein HypA/HybF involved in hydrogenase expression
MAHLESNVFYVKGKCILNSCPECGSPVPLDGFVENVTCPRCQSAFPVPQALWRTGLSPMVNVDWLLIENDVSPRWKGGIKEAEAEGFKLRVEYSRSGPSCMGCGKPLSMPDERAAGEKDFSVPCASCGRTNVFAAAPAWLNEMYGDLTHVNVESPASSPGAATGGEGRRAEPVSMQCPDCKAGLSVTADSKRLTKCEFCGATVHLPDDIWGVFHPVKKTSDWLARVKLRPESFRQSARSSFWVALMLLIWVGGGIAFLVGAVQFHQEGDTVECVIFAIVGTIVFAVPGAIGLLAVIYQAIQRYGYAKKFRE